MIVERRMRGFFSDFDYAVEELNHGWRWVGGGSEKRIGGKFYEWVLEGGGGGQRYDKDSVLGPISLTKRTKQAISGMKLFCIRLVRATIIEAKKIK